MEEKIRARYESYDENFLSETYHSPNFSLGFHPILNHNDSIWGDVIRFVATHEFLEKKNTAIRINFRAPD